MILQMRYAHPRDGRLHLLDIRCFMDLRVEIAILPEILLWNNVARFVTCPVTPRAMLIVHSIKKSRTHKLLEYRSFAIHTVKSSHDQNRIQHWQVCLWLRLLIFYMESGARIECLLMAMKRWVVFCRILPNRYGVRVIDVDAHVKPFTHLRSLQIIDNFIAAFLCALADWRKSIVSQPHLISAFDLSALRPRFSPSAFFWFLYSLFNRDHFSAHTHMDTY